MPLPAILKDKRAQLAAGAGGVLALVVLLRNQKASGEDAAGTATTGGTAGAYDSSGTDAYNNLQTSLDNQLAEFRRDLTGIQDQLGKLPTVPTVPAKPKPITGKPVTPGHPVKRPVKKPAPIKYTSYKIKRGDTLSALAKRQHTTVSTLARLNKIRNPNLIRAGATLKIPKR